MGKRRGKHKAIADESPEQKEERERAAETKIAIREVRKSVGRFFMGPANKFCQKVLGQGGENADILTAHVERMRAIFNPEEFEGLPHCIREFEKQKNRETLAFMAWKDKLQTRIDNGELPPTIRIDDLDILDMFYDVEAHSVRRATKEQTTKFENELRCVPLNALAGVLKWYNFLATQAGEAGCENLDELLIDISCRAQPRDMGDL